MYDPYLHASIVRPHIPYRSLAQEPLYEFTDPARKLRADFFDQIVGGVPSDYSYSTHDYTATDYGILSLEPFIGRDSGDMGLEGDRGLGEEPDRIRSLYIEGDDNDRVHDDNDDDGDNAGDDYQLVPLAPVPPGSSSDGRPRHGKGNGLTGSFMSVMSKILESRNKRPDRARDILMPTQRKKVKSSN